MRGILRHSRRELRKTTEWEGEILRERERERGGIEYAKEWRWGLMG